MNDIVDFIAAAAEEKPVAAMNAFSKAMSDRMDTAQETLRQEVSTNMFKSSEQGETDV